VVSSFNSITFNIPANAWDQGFHYGGGNLHRGYQLNPSVTGGLDLGSIYANGGGILAYANSTGYIDSKQLPYVISHGNNSYIGLRIEYLASRNMISISKTTNGWDSLIPTAAELPSNVVIHMVVIGGTP